MKNFKISLIAFLLPLAACTAHGEGIDITVPDSAVGQRLIVNYGAYDSDTMHADTITIAKTRFNISRPQEGKFYVYVLNINDNLVPDIYLYPGEKARLDITGLKPLTYKLTGTPLIDGIEEYTAAIEPIQNEFFDARMRGAAPVELDTIYARFLRMSAERINRDPKAAVAPYILSGLTGQTFMDEYAKVKPYLSKSPFAPYIALKRQQVQEMLKMQATQKTAESGRNLAPDFTLKDVNGREVSLSQYRGKWVVLDFWGSWCVWCVKGFPELKENYAKYRDRLEVIGIDCGDTPQVWREAVAKNALPWVNVYNPQTSDLTTKYNVQGFPTKVIINPEGRVVASVTGENPAFYTKLASFMGE